MGVLISAIFDELKRKWYLKKLSHYLISPLPIASRAALEEMRGFPVLHFLFDLCAAAYRYLGAAAWMVGGRGKMTLFRVNVVLKLTRDKMQMRLKISFKSFHD